MSMSAGHMLPKTWAKPTARYPPVGTPVPLSVSWMRLPLTTHARHTAFAGAHQSVRGGASDAASALSGEPLPTLSVAVSGPYHGCPRLVST